MGIRRIILFLDFDGVLHPKSPREGKEMFRGIPYFCEAINNFPNLQVVVSSSWRHVPKDLAWGLSLFPLDFKTKLLGSTPLLGGKLKREEEIFSWLSTNRESVENAVVLDDELELFDDLRSRVFEVDGAQGLVAETVADLVAWLASKSN